MCACLCRGVGEGGVVRPKWDGGCEQWWGL